MWLWQDVYDFSPFDEQVENVLRQNPRAKLMCVVDMNSPIWQLRSRSITDAIAHLVAAAREVVAPGKRLGVFCGYIFSHISCM